MSTKVRRLTALETLGWTLVRWRGFRLPQGERIGCTKDRRRVPSGVLIDADWAHMADQVVEDLSTHQVRANGVASGTPMQQGTDVTRTVWWGGGYGRHEQIRATVPRPVLGRYWITGYPAPQYDKRCIIAGPDGDVHEMIQFDQDAPKRAPGWPQQALGYGRWRAGHLVEGRATTASGLPSHGYVWGPGSFDEPHTQGLIVDDYVGGDGWLATGPVCGAWYALDPTSDSYEQMVALGGECAARAVALATYGLRVIDRNGRRTKADGPVAASGYEPAPASLLTQAGAWTAGTNLHQFRVALTDLRRVAAI